MWVKLRTYVALLTNCFEYRTGISNKGEIKIHSTAKDIMADSIRSPNLFQEENCQLSPLVYKNQSQSKTDLFVFLVDS